MNLLGTYAAIRLATSRTVRDFTSNAVEWGFIAVIIAVLAPIIPGFLILEGGLRAPGTIGAYAFIAAFPAAYIVEYYIVGYLLNWSWMWYGPLDMHIAFFLIPGGASLFLWGVFRVLSS